MGFFVKTLLLVSLTALVAAHSDEEEEPAVRADGGFTVKPVRDGKKVEICLDGSGSDREHAYAKWEVQVGGVWVLLKKKAFVCEKVKNKPKTYKFKLTVWDPDNDDRKDSVVVHVDIDGGKADPNDVDPDKCTKKKKRKCGYKKSKKMYADADITSVTENEVGHLVVLTAKDSINCDDYAWEYLTEDDGWVAFDMTMDTDYEVDRPGKHKFRVICFNDDTHEVDIDYTWATIAECEDVKFPDAGDNRDGPEPCANGKRHCDKCEGVNAKAKAQISDVDKLEDGSYKIYLTAENSVDCGFFEWELIERKSQTTFVGRGVEQSWVVPKKGEYKFRVTCYNHECHDKDSDNEETDCSVFYKYRHD